MIISCPTALVDAPVEIVWELLTDPGGWPSFYDLRVKRVLPLGFARIGQLVVGETGPGWLHLAVTATFTAIDVPSRSLALDIQLPLGIAVKEELTCAVISAHQCRVNYHCGFVLPSGWRGIAARMFLGREFRAGPEDSLRRLKRAAEQRFCDQHAQ